MDHQDQANPTDGEEKKRIDRAARLVIQDRLDEVRRRIGQGQSDWTIKRELSKEYGCSTRQVGRYLTRVREIIRDEMDPSKIDKHRGDSLDFYQTMSAKESAPDNARIRARENMDRILGIQQPQKIEMTAKVVPMDLKTSIKEVAELTPEQQEILAAALPVLASLAPPDTDEDDER